MGSKDIPGNKTVVASVGLQQPNKEHQIPLLQDTRRTPDESWKDTLKKIRWVSQGTTKDVRINSR